MQGQGSEISYVFLLTDSSASERCQEEGMNLWCSLFMEQMHRDGSSATFLTGHCPSQGASALIKNEDTVRGKTHSGLMASLLKWLIWKGYKV